MRSTRIIRTVLATTATTALLLGAGIVPATAAPPALPKCATLLAPATTSLMGTPGVLIGERVETGVPTVALLGSRLAAVRNVIIANRGRTCVWRFGQTTVTMSLTTITTTNRRVIDKAWWVERGVDGVGTGGISTIYHVNAPKTESGYLVDDPYYLTAVTTNGAAFPAFIQAEAYHLYDLMH